MEGGPPHESARERHTGAGDRLHTRGNSGAPRQTLEAAGRAHPRGSLTTKVMRYPDHQSRQLLALGEHERMANVVHVLWHDQMIRRCRPMRSEVWNSGLLERTVPPESLLACWPSPVNESRPSASAASGRAGSRRRRPSVINEIAATGRSPRVDMRSSVAAAVSYHRRCPCDRIPSARSRPETRGSPARRPP